MAEFGDGETRWYLVKFGIRRDSNRGGGLASIPIFDTRGYDDDDPAGVEVQDQVARRSDDQDDDGRDDDAKDDEPDPPEPRKGHGRHGAGAFTSATEVLHALTLGVLGAICAACGIGRMSRYRDKVVVRIVGQSLFGAERHVFEQARCRLCGAIIRAEGVELKVLSGDAPSTVAAIAFDAGIDGDEPPVDGSATGDPPLDARLVGRISPEGKKRYVGRLRAAGRYGAMVGDGVNDGPALKAADIGVAMGERGELVMTNLGRIGSPVIRYRTGDLVQPRPEPCPCGRPFLLLEGGVLGRVDDMVVVRGVNVFPSALESILREFPEVEEFRVEISEQSALKEIKIIIEPAAAYVSSSDLDERVGRRIAAVLL